MESARGEGKRTAAESHLSSSFLAAGSPFPFADLYKLGPSGIYGNWLYYSSCESHSSCVLDHPLKSPASSTLDALLGPFGDRGMQQWIATHRS